jgi:DNA-binding transcriptional MerR regulator
MNSLLTVGEVARLTDVPVKTVRFYADTGILPAAARSDGGYRLFTRTDVRRLRLIRRAKILGLSLQEIKEFADLAFAENCQTFEQQLQTLIDRRLEDIDRTIQELRSLRSELHELRATLADGEHHDRTCNVEDCEHCRFIDD